jgi:putative endonuclease
MTAIPLHDQTATAETGAWFVYLIECVDGSLYTGITNDVPARYAAHCAGKGARYTRSHPPLRLLGWQPFADRAAASRAEYQVKRLKPAAKRAFVQTGGNA